MKNDFEPKDARKVIYRKINTVASRMPRMEAYAIFKYIDLLYKIDSSCICEGKNYYESINYLED